MTADEVNQRTMKINEELQNLRERANDELEGNDYGSMAHHYPRLWTYSNKLIVQSGDLKRCRRYQASLPSYLEKWGSLPAEKGFRLTRAEARDYDLLLESLAVDTGRTRPDEGLDLTTVVHVRVQSEWLNRWIKERVENDVNVSIIFIGMRGSGKSYSAIRLGWDLDPEFSVDNVCFTGIEYLERFDQLSPGSVLILDDAGMGIGSRDFKEDVNKVFGVVEQTKRYTGIIGIITVPHISLIDKQPRIMADLVLEFHEGKEKGIFDVRKPVVDEKGNLKLEEYSEKKGHDKVIIDSIKFHMPYEWEYGIVAEEYEQKKDKVMGAWRDYARRVVRFRADRQDMEIQKIELDKKIMDLRSQGLTQKQISEQLGLKQGTVSKRLSRMGAR